MKINQIINLLKKDGVNSKHQVIKWLENATVEELEELKKDIEERICTIETEKN